MDPRTQIPVIALLGLSCSDCTERDGEVDPLVGEWEAIEIDGEKYPIVETSPPGEGPGVALRRGWDLEVTAAHSGTLAYFFEYGDGDASYRNEYYSDLEVDAKDAPKYRLSIRGDLVHIGGDDYYTTGYDTGVGTDTEAGPGTDTDYATSAGALDDDELVFDEFERELVGAPRGTRAAAMMILDCELKAEQLHCGRQIGADDDGEKKAWIFARVVDDG